MFIPDFDNYVYDNQNNDIRKGLPSLFNHEHKAGILKEASVTENVSVADLEYRDQSEIIADLRLKTNYYKLWRHYLRPVAKRMGDPLLYNPWLSLGTNMKRHYRVQKNHTF